MGGAEAALLGVVEQHHSRVYALAPVVITDQLGIGIDSANGLCRQSGGGGGETRPFVFAAGTCSSPLAKCAEWLTHQEHVQQTQEGRRSCPARRSVEESEAACLFEPEKCEKGRQ